MNIKLMVNWNTKKVIPIEKHLSLLEVKFLKDEGFVEVGEVKEKTGGVFINSEYFSAMHKPRTDNLDTIST